MTGAFIHFFIASCGEVKCSAFTFVPNCLRTLCVRYISEYICISALLLLIVYSQNAWRRSHPRVPTAGICWRNSHSIVNTDRKHIPDLLIDWCHSSQRRGNTGKPCQTKLGVTVVKHSQSHRGSYIVILLLFAERQCAKRSTSATALPWCYLSMCVFCMVTLPVLLCFSCWVYKT